MKNGVWKKFTLGEVCDIVNGSTPLRTKKEFWEDGEFPWFTIDDIREQGRYIYNTKQKVTTLGLSKLRILPKDTVLLCCTASVGEYALTKIELTTNQQFNGLVIKNRDLLDPLYLMYFCSDIKKELLNLSGKTTIDFIAISKLKTLEIPIPPLSEQQAIVEKLDGAFELIDQAKANIEKNIQNAKELFQSKLNEVFSQKGDGWEERKLDEVTIIKGRIGYRGYTKEDLVNKGEGAITLSPSNIVNNRFHTNNCTYISWFKYEESPEIMVFDGDILFVKTGSTYGKVAVVENLSEKATINPQFVVLKNIKINNKFLFYSLTTKIFKEKVESIVGGTATPTLSQTNLGNLTIYHPNLETQQKIVAQLDELSAQTEQLQQKYAQKLANLEELKKSILEKAFKGELTY